MLTFNLPITSISCIIFQIESICPHPLLTEKCFDILHLIRITLLNLTLSSLEMKGLHIQIGPSGQICVEGYRSQHCWSPLHNIRQLNIDPLPPPFNKNKYVECGSTLSDLHQVRDFSGWPLASPYRHVVKIILKGNTLKWLKIG